MKMIAITISMGVALSAAVFAAAPYPPSPVITDLTWAPASSIVRLAGGCDNWPLTWGDDGHMYTVWGDGNGFDGVDRYRLGVARVEGSPPSGVKGYEIGGDLGGKGRAILMVNGTLYLTKDVGNMLWSTDHGRSWQARGWKFRQFGFVALLNFGRDYSGARDGYVYQYSPDVDSAYSASKHMILMRVPKDSMLIRSAYEFFTGLDGNGNPQWSSNVADRQPVFTNQEGGQARCARHGISYNAALGRYLWWQQRFNGTIDTRASGGFGIYDAPEPWGPWTTVYYTEKWDVGPGECASFPTKWMSADGKTLWLVFSGDDTFAMRKATLTAGATPPPPPPPPVDTTPPAAPQGLAATPAP